MWDNIILVLLNTDQMLTTNKEIVGLIPINSNLENFLNWLG